MNALPPVCILAGGLGTRLGSRVRDTPKPLLPVAGEPFLFHQLRLLASHGAHEVVLCVGYLGASIQQSVGSRRFGLRISYSFDGPELAGDSGSGRSGDHESTGGPGPTGAAGLAGTLGAIRGARSLLGERFLVLYGDAYLSIDYGAAASAWKMSGLPAMMSVLRNGGRWDASNAIYREGRVLAYDKRAPSTAMKWIDYGLSGLEQATLDRAPAMLSDLSDLFHLLATERQLFGFPASRRFYEIGTPKGLAETDAFLRGVPQGRLAVKR
jgi:NDP-sugar pyrophosphorylase family protein